MTEQTRFTIILIMYLAATVVTLVALAVGIAADEKRKAAEVRSIEWKQLYCREKERCEKLASENSFLRNNAKLPCVEVSKALEGRVRKL